MQLRMISVSVAMGLAMMFVSNAAVAQYHRTRLDSNQVGSAPNIDPLGVNDWGLVHGPGSPWWIADEGSGWSTLYKGDGTIIQQLKVLIPTAGENGPGSATGIVFNGSQDFQIQGGAAVFLFAALDGSISGWAPGVNFNSALPAPLKNAPAGASYTGLAISSNASGNFLFAADMANGQVDMYDANFNFTKSFTDPAIPAGFVPFGIRDIGGIVYVVYAGADETVTGGFVEQFKEDGTPVTPGKALISGTPLNQPWGIAIAPAGFGPFSNMILISNNTDQGTINAFNPVTGKFLGTLKAHRGGKPIVIDQLWGIDFGDGKGSNGATNELFYTAGPKGNLVGEFGKIVFVDKDRDDD